MKKDFDNLFISKKLKIKDAMKQMDKASKKILFVMDGKRRLLGTVTDGDIRRWILAVGNLQKRVDRIYNKKPIYVKEGLSTKEARDVIVEASVESLPVVDKTMRIVDIIFWKDVIREGLANLRCRRDIKIPLVIMAGGEGSRLDPFTRILPKALIPIDDKPVVELVINNFLQYLSGDIYLILGYKGEMIKSYFDNSRVNYKISYFYEGSKRLGTAGGLQLIPNNFPNTFFLSNCDTIIKARYDDIYMFHKKNRYDLTIIGSMQHFVVPYGVMKLGPGGRLNRIEEKPEYDFLVNTGMYVVEKKVLRYIPNQEKPFHITDLMRKIKASKGRIGVYPVSEKSWLDVGQWESYKETTKNLLGEL